ncbi:MAG: glycolate oxidase [Candidatus Woesearchaeota archaeon]|nr:glycolate oxidase [Candidatus Woesearchaeota archaeon]
METQKLKEIILELNKKGIEYKQLEKDVEVYAYSQDASTIEILPTLVLFPKNKDEIKEIIKICKENQISLTARGAGTNLVGNALNDEVIIDLSRLNNIIEINEKEKYAIVEPGVICNNLNRKLKETVFPVIPSSHRVCTIGGMINCNSAGNWSYKFGKLEQWIDEVIFLDANCKEVSSKEIIGSEGLLGIVIRAKLRLISKPRVRIESKEYSNINEMLEDLKNYKNNENTIMLEVVDKQCSKELLNSDKIILLAGLLDDKAKEQEYEDILRIREKAYPTLAEKGFILIEDPQIPEENLDKFLGFLEENNIPYFGHIGSGIIHPCFKKDQKELIKKMYQVVKELKGKVSGEHGIGLKKLEFVDEEFANKLIELKKRYDPYDIFNRKLSNALKEKIKAKASN